MNNFTGSMCNAAPRGAVSLKKKKDWKVPLKIFEIGKFCNKRSVKTFAFFWIISDIGRS